MSDQLPDDAILGSRRLPAPEKAVCQAKSSSEEIELGCRRKKPHQNHALSFSTLLASCLWLFAIEVVEGLIHRPPLAGRSSLSGILLAAQLRSGSTGDASLPPAEEEAAPAFLPEYTGVDVQFDWELAGRPIPLAAERALLESGVLWRRGEFNRIEGRRVAEVEAKCRELGMTRDQGFFVRKQLAVTKVMRNTWKLKGENFDNVEREFSKRRRTLLQLGRDLDLPPVSIFRAVLRQRVDVTYPDMLHRDKKQLVKSVISADDAGADLGHSLLTEWENEQLQTAKEFDIIGYSAVASEIESNKWEEAIYTFLDDRDVNYLAEDDMRAVGSRITPDCLLLDDCVINGREVRWIDAKNYYGSGLRESNGMMNKMKKQIAKYEAEFGGSGAIVFKHGFSQKFTRTLPSTLFLDSGPLHLR
uniref:CDAN1-interacting nuclease 1 n=1 Tax=Odontella aurita TaxID=265563 RepID=A0A7S4K148_9STRA|mmetsp:Transcript_59163/g.175839  ORF Transcript_59163/g.175839 Transcript_59163/m.175839 type:complete len:416 (+) Transcript_59163:53-1300(+)